uniref:Mucin-5AC n=1 Tax=Anopheles christyi TaxID=43041 RepID=A0A182K566_9DIPT
MTTLRLIAIMLVYTVLVLSHVAHCEPNYQPQQQPGGNDFSGAGGGVNTGNALYGAPNQQQQQQQLQQQQLRPYPPSGPAARYRPASPATTPAPTFFQRISSWFSFLGDDSGERRPVLQQQQQTQQPLQPQLPPPRHLPPPPHTVQPTPSVQTQQQLQFQQQQFQQQYPPQPPQLQQQQQQQFPYPFQIRNGSRATQLAPHQPIVGNSVGGFQPSAPVQESSGSSYHAAIAPGVPQNTFVPSTLQQQIVPQANVFRDPEPTTGRTPVGNIGEVNYHPCNNVPWVPIAAPPEYPTAVGGKGGAIPAGPPKVPQNVPNRPPPIKIQVAPKGQVQSVHPYAGASGPGGSLEPAIITAAPQAQQLIQLQLQQQQHQLQNLQLQQLQIQQQQLQQQLQQLKTTTTTAPPAPIVAHFITKTPDALVTAGPSSTLQPITLRQVSASYFTNKEYAPPAKLLPIQNEGKPLAPIPLPNLSATPIPPLYTAGSFHSDPYKFYRPYRPVEPILELGHGYPSSSKSMSNSYIRYPHEPKAKNESVFDVEQFASSASSSIYTTVAYSNGEDSKPAASEKRNVATSSNGSSGANIPPREGSNGDDAEYDSEEDDHSSPIIRTTIEVSSIVPQTRWYGSTTTPVSTSSTSAPTTPRPERPSTFPTPAPSDLGNGVQIIYSANLQTNSPIVPVNNQLSEEEEPTEAAAQRVVQTTVRPETTTPDPETTPPTDIYTEPFRIGSSLPMEFQKQSTPEPASQTVVITASTNVDLPSTTATPLPSSLTATFGGYQNLMSTKKPKQIQIIIPYNTYKKPEPFRPLPPQDNLDDLDYNAPEESSIVTSKHSGHSGPTPPSGNAIHQASQSKTRFFENDSVKYFQSTAHLREILQKETTQPFMKPPTKTPPKPAKVKKVRPVEISKESKPFTARIPKMTPLPPVVSLSSLTSVRGGMERHTTPLPDESHVVAGSRTPSPPIALSKYARPVTPHYVNVTRVKISPTTYAQKSRTTISQLLRTTKIIPKGPKLFGNDLLVSETSRTVRPPLSPASTTYQHQRRTTFLTTSSTTPRHTTTTTTTTTSTTEQPLPPEPVQEDADDNTVGPIYERTIDWDIDPNELQRKIDTWTEQEFGSDDFARKASTLSLHRVTKAIPWEFLTSTMLPALHDKPGKTSRSGWQHVKIAISPITKEKIYVVTPQPWTAALLNHHHHHHHHNHHQEHQATAAVPQILEERNGRVLTPRFSVRPTPLYYKGGGIYQTGSSTVDVSPES